MLYKHLGNVTWKIIDNEAVLLWHETGDILVLNETASFIWRLLDGKNDIETITSEITKNFDVSEPQAKKDAIDIIQTLLAKKAIDIVAD